MAQDNRVSLPTGRAETERELAERWNLSVKTLQQWRWLGGGPPFVKAGRAVRYIPAVADAWFTARSADHTAARLPPMPRREESTTQ